MKQNNQTNKIDVQSILQQRTQGKKEDRVVIAIEPKNKELVNNWFMERTGYSVEQLTAQKVLSKVFLAVCSKDLEKKE